MRTTTALRCFAGLVLMLASLFVWAHDLGVARVQLKETAGGQFIIEAKLPPQFEADEPILPKACTVKNTSTRRPQAITLIMRWEFACRGPLSADSDLLILPWDRQGAFVTAKWHDGSEAGRFFDAEQKRIVVPLKQLRGNARSTAETTIHYLTLGVEHILFGWDHLAFVLALCLIACGWRLAKLVTAFTIGHSLTLALAVLGLVYIPIPPVEACIALSIAFVAREALRPQHRLHHGVGLVFAFGLLHGLGFASALNESGIERNELLLGLFTFNLGVELGQLLFVAAVMALVWSGRRLPLNTGLRPATAFSLGALGMFWTFERIAVFS